MNELMEIKFRILELSYKYDKPIKDVMGDLKKIRVGKHTEESKVPPKPAKSTPPARNAPAQPAQPSTKKQDQISKPLIEGEPRSS